MFKNQKVVKRLSIVIFTIVMIHVVVIGVIAHRLLSPPHRDLQAYHLAYLMNNTEQGMRIAQHKTTDKTPYIITQPTFQKIGKRGKRIRAQLISKGFDEAIFNQQNGVIVLIHGRGGRKEDLLPVAERFSALGFICILPDLPAHGDSPIASIHFATSTHEKSYIYNVIQDVHKRYGWHQLPHFLWGMSLGGAFANATAYNAFQKQQQINWQAMIIVSSFDTLENTLSYQLHYLPQIVHGFYIDLLQFAIYLQGGFDIANVKPIKQAKHITLPTLVIHGTDDDVIHENQGKHLYIAYASQDKKWLSVPKANHHNVLITDMPVYANMAEWLIGHVEK